MTVLRCANCWHHTQYRVAGTLFIDIQYGVAIDVIITGITPTVVIEIRPVFCAQERTIVSVVVYPVINHGANDSHIPVKSDRKAEFV